MRSKRRRAIEKIDLTLDEPITIDLCEEEIKNLALEVPPKRDKPTPKKTTDQSPEKVTSKEPIKPKSSEKILTSIAEMIKLEPRSKPKTANDIHSNRRIEDETPELESEEETPNPKPAEPPRPETTETLRLDLCSDNFEIPEGCKSVVVYAKDITREEKFNSNIVKLYSSGVSIVHIKVPEKFKFAVSKGMFQSITLYTKGASNIDNSGGDLIAEMADLHWNSPNLRGRIKLGRNIKKITVRGGIDLVRMERYKDISFHSEVCLLQYGDYLSVHARLKRVEVIEFKDLEYLGNDRNKETNSHNKVPTLIFKRCKIWEYTPFSKTVVKLILSDDLSSYFDITGFPLLESLFIFSVFNDPTEIFCNYMAISDLPNLEVIDIGARFMDKVGLIWDWIDLFKSTKLKKVRILAPVEELKLPSHHLESCTISNNLIKRLYYDH
jgi:hypothetical protein